MVESTGARVLEAVGPEARNLLRPRSIDKRVEFAATHRPLERGPEGAFIPVASL